MARLQYQWVQQNGPNHHGRSPAVCLTDVELTFLTKDDVQLVAVDYPFLMERINALAAKRLARDGIKMNTILDETAKSLGVDPNGQQVRLTALPGPGGVTVLNSIALTHLDRLAPRSERPADAEHHEGRLVGQRHLQLQHIRGAADHDDPGRLPARRHKR